MSDQAAIQKDRCPVCLAADVDVRIGIHARDRELQVPFQVRRSMVRGLTDWYYTCQLCRKCRDEMACIGLGGAA